MTSTMQDSSTEQDTDAMTDGAPAKVVYDRNTWQGSLQRSAQLFDKSAGDRKRASTLLWQGAQAAIGEWEPKAATDVNAEVLYADVLDILGTPRKGDASKIKTVALAVRNHGLVIALYPNLSKAYAEANRLTKTVKQDQADDDAAEKAVEALAAEAPHSATTGESAAKIVLRNGLDEAARLLLDALGAGNDAAHRALLRALSNEIAGRVKPKTSTTKAGPKAGATQATTGAAGPKATVKAGAKAKPGTAGVQHKQAKATPVKGTKATPVAKQQATPVAKKAAPVKTTATDPVKHAEQADPAAIMFSDESKTAPAAVVAAKKAAPVVAVKRA